MPSIATDEHYILFADDTSLSMRSGDLEGLRGSLGEARSGAELWFRKNSLVLNEEKTSTMLFTLRDAERSSGERSGVGFLGVKLDMSLRWNLHIEHVAGKLKSGVFVLRSLLGSVSESVLRTAYFALCHSIMSYSVLAWGHAPQWRRVFALQRRAVRVVGGVGYRGDCRDTFSRLGILTFPCLFIYECLLYVRKHLDLYPTNACRHGLAVRSGEHLSVPFRRLERARTGPGYWAVKFYNKLPRDFKELPLERFKSRVQQLLLQRSFYDTEEFLSCSV